MIYLPSGEIFLFFITLSWLKVWIEAPPVAATTNVSLIFLLSVALGVVTLNTTPLPSFVIPLQVTLPSFHNNSGVIFPWLKISNGTNRINNMLMIRVIEYKFLFK